MKLDNNTKTGITNHQIEEAIRLWDGGKGLNLSEIGCLYGRPAQSFHYHFKKRGLLPLNKSKNSLLSKQL